MDAALTISQGSPGQKFRTQTKRISGEEQERFCHITDHTLPLFLSDEAAQERGWSRRLVPGVMTLSCSVGLMEQAGLLDDVVAFMALDKLRYLAPVYVGDELHVEVECVAKKSTKGGYREVVTYRFTTFNQDGRPVLEAQNT